MLGDGAHLCGKREPRGKKGGGGEAGARARGGEEPRAPDRRVVRVEPDAGLLRQLGACVCAGAGRERLTKAVPAFSSARQASLARGWTAVHVVYSHEASSQAHAGVPCSCSVLCDSCVIGAGRCRVTRSGVPSTVNADLPSVRRSPAMCLATTKTMIMTRTMARPDNGVNKMYEESFVKTSAS